MFAGIKRQGTQISCSILMVLLATQMGTSVKMLELFYSKVSPQMNAAIHSGRLETIKREEQED